MRGKRECLESEIREVLPAVARFVQLLLRLLQTTEQRTGQSSDESAERRSETAISRGRRSDVYVMLQEFRPRFTDKQWVVLTHYYRDDKSVTEIAEMLGLSVSTVSGRHTRAEAEFEKALRERRREAYEICRTYAKE